MKTRKRLPNYLYIAGHHLTQIEPIFVSEFEYNMP